MDNIADDIRYLLSTIDTSDVNAGYFCSILNIMMKMNKKIDSKNNKEVSHYCHDHVRKYYCESNSCNELYMLRENDRLCDCIFVNHCPVCGFKSEALSQ